MVPSSTDLPKPLLHHSTHINENATFTRGNTPKSVLGFSDSHPHELRRVSLRVLCYYIGDINDPTGPFAHVTPPYVAIRSFLIEYGTTFLLLILHHSLSTEQDYFSQQCKINKIEGTQRQLLLVKCTLP